MNELFPKGKEARISIFQDWNIIAPLMKFAKDAMLEQTKPEQIRRAEELLNDSELIHNNIYSFLQTKKDLTERVLNHKYQLETMLQQIYDLNSNRTQNVSEEDNIVRRMREILQELYRELRTGKVIERHISQYFQSANLTNYNPHVHQLKFSNNQETERTLFKKLEEIRAACKAIFRSIHYQEKLAGVFSKEESLAYCYATLHEMVGHDSMVRIHANMICQLKEVDDMKAELAAVNQAAQSEYAKYELIYDCLELMKTEREEIEKEKHSLEDNFTRAASYVPVAQGYYSDRSKLGQEEALMHESMGKGLESEAHIESNLRVYRTNLQNFTRVSAETSLYCYAYRQTQFIEALSSFENFFERWKRNHSHLTFLYDQRGLLQNIKQRQSVTSTYSENNRQTLGSLYDEVRNRTLPQDPALEDYKRSLLTDFERELQNQRIGFAQRDIRKEDAKNILTR
jgi:hypothetical protein